ncbi:MAG: hypothetical protein JST85_09685 [Acidobacteria bacterium]|nr:hypothetical protein [Acidobacteriota bacterium]
MPGIQEFSQQVRSIIDVVIRFVRARKREEASISFGTLLILGGVYLSSGLEKVGLKDFFATWHGEAIVRGLLIAVGIGFVLYGGYKIFRLVYVPPLPPGKDRPSAIKGPMAFTEADGELFRKLGRESELQKLLGLMLDDQVLMVVVRGASGAGKTSLLRAGLKHILGDRATFHYWEAVPTEPDKGLLRALQEKWPEGASKPASLDELVNPADTVGRQSHVIVLDQFEQLRGGRRMFSLLRRIVRESRPPHRITWVIAFRREFSADWMDFVSPEIERGVRPPQDVSLRLFTPEQAREVIGQLVNESNLKDSIEQSVINNLVEAATVESEVSPVDIGIGLLVLAELHERQSGNTITIRDYQFAGGAEGLLTQYISRCLDLFPNSDQEAILKAMLALRDPETNQRLAEGLTVDELAAESGTEARLLKTQLDRLSHRDTRLIETVMPKDGSPMRYRLPHERLILALYRLTGKVLAEVDQAKLKFQNAFQAWKTNDKRRYYLLKAKELRLVERYETQIPWGNDEQEKKTFLRASQRRRMIIKGVAVTALIALIGITLAGYFQYQRTEGRRYLRESGYPEELYDWQHQLKKLELTEPLNLENFTWLTSDSIEELSLKAAKSSNSIVGLSSLSKCGSLKKLSLDLSGDVTAEGTSGTQVSNLEPLSKLSNLQQLTLNLRVSEVSNLEPLSKLSNLQQLRLDLRLSKVSNLEPLLKLSNLQQLRLDLSDSEESNLEPLLKLSNLQQLRLDLSDSEVSNWEPLLKLSNLQQLRLDLSDSEASNLEPLSKLSNRTHLTLDLSHSRESNLEPLSKLSNLQQLTLFLGTKVSNLEPLSKLSNLQQLTLDLYTSEVSNLEPLLKLSNLQQLTLSLGIKVSNLEPLLKLSNLQQLTLDLYTIEVDKLEVLSKLSNQTQLTLDLNHSRVSNLEPLLKLSNRTQLTLDLNSSKVSNLEPLSKLSNRTQLVIGLSGSQVNKLDVLSKLTNLQKLSDESATRAQRMSLRNLPASVVELTF